MNQNRKWFATAAAFVLLLSVLLSACQPQTVEVPKEVIVTQIVPGEVQEVIVTQRCGSDPNAGKLRQPHLALHPIAPRSRS